MSSVSKPGGGGVSTRPVYHAGARAGIGAVPMPRFRSGGGSIAPGMRLRSYRFALGTWIGMTILGLGLLVLFASYAISATSVRTLAAQQFREVTRRQVLATQARLGAAAPALDTLDALLTNELEDASSERLARAFLGVLQANPGFTWVSYGDESGAFAGAYRTADGRYRINRSRIVDGRTELTEHEVQADGAWKEIRHDPDTGYDPRTRPFYELAKAAGHRVWTRPYVFYEQAIPGITCARPHRARDGSLAGVLTIDFDLNALSDFMRTADLSPNGTVLLFAPDGTLLAHPRVTVVARSGAGDEGHLLSVADLESPAMKALAREMGVKHDVVELEGGLKLQTFPVEVGGERHLASFTAFPVDSELLWFVGAIAPESDFLGPVRTQMFWLFAAMLAALAVTVVFVSNFLSEKFASQLRVLSDGMAEVGRLELADKPLPRSNVREIVAMQQALAAMKGGLRSFARYVPRDLVRRVLSSGREAVLGGETRELTVFFSDIEGFTSVAESMAPAELVEMLGEYLEEMTRIIAAHGGTVDKYLGDGILAFWGAPEEDPAHARRAAVAALDCAAAAGAAKLRTRIGLATGPVLVGNIGTPERMNYTVMGDTVNLASRLEGLNKAYGTRILVSEATAAALGSEVIARAVDVVAVKGKSKGVKVYELLARATGVPAEDADRRWLAEISELTLADYVARDFAKASAGWARILESRPGDLPAARMKERADAYEAEPPPADWTGVTIAKEK